MKKKIQSLKDTITDLNSLKSFAEFKAKGLFLDYLRQNYSDLVKEVELKLKSLNKNSTLVGAFILKSTCDGADFGLDRVFVKELVFNVSTDFTQKTGYKTIHILDEIDFGENCFDENEQVGYLIGADSELHILRGKIEFPKNIDDFVTIADFYPDERIEFGELNEFKSYFTHENQL